MVSLCKTVLYPPPLSCRLHPPHTAFFGRHHLILLLLHCVFHANRSSRKVYLCYVTTETLWLSVY